MTQRRILLLGGAATVIIVIGLALLVVAPALGLGQDRPSLARQATQTYWTDISAGKVRPAYQLLTSGTRAALPIDQYSQNIFSFLGHTAGIKATVGAAEVKDDRAVVSIALHSPKTTQVQKGYQHLFWENGAWHISDQNGGISLFK